MPEKKAKKDPYDTTSSRRQSGYLQKLTAAGGKRLPVDFSAEDLQRIAELNALDPELSTADVIRGAIRMAHSTRIK